ncbi:ligase-associated DNA damage response endonuclease PdeM [Shivajiella indica]|uniref:Ligase-associated DNA damage response endonuclease PdeM n=1 Tax=Shivajiella indica TaxID=872115 RepID=A0ABW5BDJ5_9BACT
MQELTIKGAYIFDWEGVQIHLLPQKAIYLPDYKALLIADPHFGKAAHFRKSGIPVPENVHFTDYLKIQKLFQFHPLEEVFFLGDLFHSDWNNSWNELELFLSQFQDIQFHLIKGNHDILEEPSYRSDLWKIHHETFEMGPFILSHEPMENVKNGMLNICGHIHPGISLYGLGRQNISLPCFFVRQQSIIMPAFGRFTGLAIMQCGISENAFVVTDKKVIPVNFTA